MNLKVNDTSWANAVDRSVCVRTPPPCISANDLRFTPYVLRFLAVSRLSWCVRQSYVYLRSNSKFTFNPDRSSMSINHIFHNFRTESCPAWLGAKGAFSEEPIAHVRR